MKLCVYMLLSDLYYLNRDLYMIYRFWLRQENAIVMLRTGCTTEWECNLMQSLVP